MKNEKKQVTAFGGLKQNCFLLDTHPKQDIKHEKDSGYYMSLEKKQLPNGYQFELERSEYPINSESVTSYLEASDFKRDPLMAIANAPKRVNLGDIREVQAFIRENPQEAVRIYKSVGDKLSEYFKQQQEAATAEGNNQTHGGEN